MKRHFAKISFILLSLIFLISCNAVKRVESDETLLTENIIYLNDEQIKENRIYNQLYQEPNTRLLRFPIRLYFYNLARPNIDSLLYERYLADTTKRENLSKILSRKQLDKLIHSRKQFNQWIKNAGEAPVIVSEEDTRKSANRLQSWYWNHGWFNVETNYDIIPSENRKQRAKVEYYITTKEPYEIDSISTLIESRVIDSIYEAHKDESEIAEGTQYRTLDFNAERDRLTQLFRDNGVYNFDQEYISFDADTIQTGNKVNTTLIIKNRQVTEGDSTYRTPFETHEISKVNIFTDYSFADKNRRITDSIQNEGYTLYSFDNLEYKPEAITDAVFIRPGHVYSDTDRTRTYNRLNSLRLFKYPNISFTPDPADTTRTDLVANIFLTPQPKYSLGFDFDVSQSNIQKFGIGFGGSLLIRNVFRGAENLEISGRGSIGSSTDAAVSREEDQFFDISEIGADLKLTFPRLFLPFETENLIPKYMSPFTSLSTGVSTQHNIGLDKQNVTGILNYRWNPSRQLSNRIDLLNIQYVKNLNTANYFNVYRSSYDDLNTIVQSANVVTDPAYLDEGGNLTIPQGAEAFIEDVNRGSNTTTGLTQAQRQHVSNIRERKNRLTEDNLIFASNYTYLWNTKENLYDKEFTRFRFKIETAGNFLTAFSELAGLPRNDNGNFDIMEVNFSQYVKPELDFIKHWDLGRNNIIAFRGFGGVAIPYGNANSIPFARSFFAGGPNDNRAWQAYDLGPGSSGGRNEFNEANMKLAINLEYRYNLIGALHGAFFTDVGNIWNFMDIVDDEASTFTSFSDLEELAVGTGFGLRYDFDFFILRFDVGFKTYNPAHAEGNRWFREYNFNNAVYNVGINYPF